MQKKRCFGNTENIENRLEQQLILFESQSSEIEKEIKELSMSDPEFMSKSNEFVHFQEFNL